MSSSRRPSKFQLCASSPAGPVWWRLLGGNRHDLGHSPVGYPEPESCLVALSQLLHRREEAAGRVYRVGGGRWSWVLTLDGVPAAVAPGAFQRLGRCRQALARFVELAGVADVSSRVSSPPRAVRPGVSLATSGGWERQLVGD